MIAGRTIAAAIAIASTSASPTLADRIGVPAGTGLKAKVQLEHAGNTPAVYFTLPQDMTFLPLTRGQVGQRLRIYVGCRLVSEPVIREPIAGRQGLISGAFSLEEAKAIADTINNGATPCTLPSS